MVKLSPSGRGISAFLDNRTTDENTSPVSSTANERTTAAGGLLAMVVCDPAERNIDVSRENIVVGVDGVEHFSSTRAQE